MNDYYEFPDLQHLYGYCVYPTALAGEQIEAGRDFRYHIVVIDNTSNNGIPDSVIVMSYEFSLDQLVAFIRDTDGQIISIQRNT